MQDQHQQPAFVNANAGLAYVTVPQHGRPPRTRLIVVPPPSFQQVMTPCLNQALNATTANNYAMMNVAKFLISTHTATHVSSQSPISGMKLSVSLPITTGNMSCTKGTNTTSLKTSLLLMSILKME